MSNTPRTPAPRHRKPRRGVAVATAAAPYPKPSAPPTASARETAISTPQTQTRPALPTALESNFSTVRFRDFFARGKISSQVLQGIPFEFCTHVQAETMDVVLDGVDVCVCAMKVGVV